MNAESERGRETGETEVNERTLEWKREEPRDARQREANGAGGWTKDSATPSLPPPPDPAIR